MKNLLSKYDVPVPRYTSYPTVPSWELNLDESTWISHVRRTLEERSSAWAMYIHVPFCETLCTFCGCNNVITKNHRLEDPYVDLLLGEWRTYLQEAPNLGVRPLKHLHIGGGTPTFLSAMNLNRLLSGILDGARRSEDIELSIEVDPRRTTEDQLRVLRDLGFNRISLGVQDFDPEVQRLVNRIQPFEMTESITNVSRKLGFESVNFDLIYGLARQTATSMRETARRTLELKPDRIALYSFALVPWIKPAQRLFKDEDLPKAAEKRELYEIAREIFLSEGYVEIGMDHFALATDGLALAQKEGRLHRNFMGYTDQRSDLLLALGVSGISETPWSFHQNEKLMPKYEEKVRAGAIPTMKGHVHSDDDRFFRNQILEFVTKYTTTLTDDQILDADEFLAEMMADGLIIREGTTLRLTEQGRPFLRNACAFFDQRMRTMKPETQIFSKSI